jgi:hypothetical protein
MLHGDNLASGKLNVPFPLSTPHVPFIVASSLSGGVYSSEPCPSLHRVESKPPRFPLLRLVSLVGRLKPLSEVQSVLRSDAPERPFLEELDQFLLPVLKSGLQIATGSDQWKENWWMD